MKRTASVVLAALNLLPLLAGCRAESDPETEAVSAPAVEEADPLPAGEEETSGQYEVRDELPEGLDFKGESMRILHCDWDITTKEIYVEEDDGEILNSAIYARNALVQDRLNLKIVPTSSADQQETLRHSVASAYDEFDLCGGYRYYAMSMATEGILRNLYHIDYVDTSKPWWAKSFVEAATVGDKRFFLSGDGALSMLYQMGVMFVDYPLYELYIGEIPDLYQLVLDGGWTLDQLSSMAEQVYEDRNGNGKRDMDDAYGYSSQTYAALDFMVTAADIRWSETDADGDPQFCINNERTANFVERLYRLLYENKGAYAATFDNGRMSAVAIQFPEDRMMFMQKPAATAEMLRDMESDYAIIPCPKYDEAQAEYKTCVHDGMTAFCVPVTNDKHWEMTGAFMEAFFSESWRTVTDVYYETLLKQKYARDPVAAEMLDITKRGVSFDFVLLHSNALGDCVHMIREIITEGSYDFASAWAGREKSLEKSLRNLVKLYREAE